MADDPNQRPEHLGTSRSGNNRWPHRPAAAGTARGHVVVLCWPGPRGGGHPPCRSTGRGSAACARWGRYRLWEGSETERRCGHGRPRETRRAGHRRRLAEAPCPAWAWHYQRPGRRTLGIDLKAQQVPVALPRTHPYRAAVVPVAQHVPRRRGAFGAPGRAQASPRRTWRTPLAGRRTPTPPGRRAGRVSLGLRALQGENAPLLRRVADAAATGAPPATRSDPDPDDGDPQARGGRVAGPHTQDPWRDRTGAAARSPCPPAKCAGSRSGANSLSL